MVSPAALTAFILFAVSEVPVAPVGGVVSRQAYMLRIPLDFEYEKEIVEGTYYE